VGSLFLRKGRCNLNTGFGILSLLRLILHIGLVYTFGFCFL
jgi:hypothetical protein